MVPAEIVRSAKVGSKGIDLYWWPKFAPLKGWEQDKSASEENGINALAPKGYTFSNATVVIYGRACYKPNWGEKTLSAFIKSDKQESLKQFPGQKLIDAPPITNGNGIKMRSIEFYPSGNGNWERVAYSQEGDFYLVFTLSSRKRSSYNAALPAFVELLKAYKK